MPEYEVINDVLRSHKLWQIYTAFHREKQTASLILVVYNSEIWLQQKY